MAFDLALVCNPSGGGMIPAALAKRIEALCKAEELPPEGITIMGGNPYINVTGLDNKIRRRAERENLVFAGCAVEAVPADGDRREFKATVTYFDKAGFLEALKAAPGAPADVLRALQLAFTFTYTDIGSCSLKTAKMSTMQNADNIAMLASRRASNRAKRAATGVGLTSIDEVAGELQNGKAGKGPVTIDVQGKTLPPEGHEEPAGGAAMTGAEEEAFIPLQEEPSAGAVPASAAAPPPAGSAPPPSACISGKQGGRLWAKLHAGAKDKADKDGRTALLKDWLTARFGYAHTDQIPRGKPYEEACAEADRIASHA